jgi:hypothetical protein
MSQQAAVLRHLKRAPITPMIALREYGCFRLAAIIFRLRGKGYRIDTEMITRDDSTFARYRLFVK